MKGINLKKIGAIVAGATILASSVAFAGLMFENTELVNANGAPLAKVVIGANAAASDGVVASTIAAKLASSAYVKKTYTAAVANDATCDTNATSGAGKCTVTDEKVVLEVTVPGATNTGVHEFSTLIADYIDREPGNRNNAGTDDNYLLTESETDADANPFSNGDNGYLEVNQSALYKIDSKNFVPFATKTILDPNSGQTYTETQTVWLNGQTEFGDEKIQGNLNLLVYQAKFDEGTHTGIPVCTKLADTANKDWAQCTSTDSEYTGKHRVKISLLGSDWIITELEPGTGTLFTVDKVDSTGGSMKLAKESVYGILNAGQTLNSSDGQFKVRLDDVAIPVTQDQVANAIVSFLDANDNVIAQDQISPGETTEKSISGKTYKVRVYQTAPGLGLSKWAEMAMLEEELELKDGDSLDDDENEDWNVELMWKNKDATTTYNTTDTLRGIILYKDNSALGDNLNEGDSVNLIEDPITYKLKFKGLNLANGDYSDLKYTTGGSTSPSMYTDGQTCSLAENSYIKVTSSVDDAFSMSGAKGKDFYYLLENATGNCTTNSTNRILMKKSGSTKYTVLENADVVFKTAGSQGTDADGGVLELSTTDNISTINLVEDAGALDTDDHTPVSLKVTYNTSADGFRSAAHKEDKITLDLPADFPTDMGYENGEDYDEDDNFISPRGTLFESMKDDEVIFKVANKVGKVLYEFATTEAAQAESTSTSAVTLTEGQSQMFDTVTVKIKSIDETVGPCTAIGGSANCTITKDKISAVIMPTNTASIDVKEIVPMDNIVVLDKDVGEATGTTLITVGGNIVNTVTAAAMKDDGSVIDFNKPEYKVVVKQIGNKIIVAGLTADDTVAAGQEFLNKVKVQ
ncbi:MAG: S-layer protein [Candidatus Micrarchaeota archaeon]